MSKPDTPLAYRVETTLTDGTIERSRQFAFRSAAHLHQEAQRTRPDIVATALVPVDPDSRESASLLHLVASQPGLNPAFRAGIVVAAHASGA